MTTRALLIALAACSAPAEHGTTGPKAGSAAPQVNTPPPATAVNDGPLEIALRDSGEIRIDDDPVDPAALDDKLRAAAVRHPQVYVEVGRGVASDRLHDMLARAQAAGLEHIAVTELPPDVVLGVPPSPIGLVWEMHVEGDQLRIDYTITNGTDHAISAVDALWKSGGGSDSDSIVVRAGKPPDTIAFTRAFVPPPPGWKIEHVDRKAPHYVEIPAAGELRGTAHTKLPLGAAHNFAGTYAITGTRAKAVLEIGFVDGKKPDKLLRSAVKPLPAGAHLASPEDQVAHGSNVERAPLLQ